jgi:hypothetical protein
MMRLFQSVALVRCGKARVERKSQTDNAMLNQRIAGAVIVERAERTSSTATIQVLVLDGVVWFHAKAEMNNHTLSTTVR